MTVIETRMNWQPIETAPKDGTFVLLTDTNFKPCHLIGMWANGAWWGQRTQSGKSLVWIEATHWMPLPEPPTPMTHADEAREANSGR